ncbi:MAG: hypothetical protein ABJL67_02695 [Sulfitobacter sp.]
MSHRYPGRICRNFVPVIPLFSTRVGSTTPDISGLFTAEKLRRLPDFGSPDMVIKKGHLGAPFQFINIADPLSRANLHHQSPESAWRAWALAKNVNCCGMIWISKEIQIERDII